MLAIKLSENLATNIIIVPYADNYNTCNYNSWRQRQYSWSPLRAAKGRFGLMRGTRSICINSIIIQSYNYMLRLYIHIYIYIYTYIYIYRRSLGHLLPSFVFSAREPTDRPTARLGTDQPTVPTVRTVSTNP